jgi:replicative DNA helicase
MPVMVTEALEYAKRGWYVFPCREKPGTPFIRNGETVTPAEKTPYVSKGLNDATTDEELIKAWWKRWPDAMIGINAGKSGLFVLDIDKKHVNGLETFNQWNINDTAGLHSITPSGGMHIVFTGSGKSTTGAKIGIDTRGEGGYFIAPPSKILAGANIGEYKTFDDWGRTPGIIPDGLLAKIFPDTTVNYVRGTVVPTNSEKKQLSRASLNFLANGAPAGERNSTLFKVLADFAGCGYTQQAARESVMPVCERIGLGAGEFEQVLTHAYSKPRTSSIPDTIQEKIMEGGKNVASKITVEEQSVLEDVLLACLLTDNTLIPAVNDILSYEDFQAFKNRIIYKAINRLYNSGAKVDYFTASNEVARETDKVKLDDISRIINQYYVNTDHVLTYAEIIKEKASIRRIEVILDNKEQYIKCGNLVEIINNIEKDVSDIALAGGAKSTNVLTGKQAVDMVTEWTRMMETGKIQQLKTGFVEYDSYVGGLYTNDLMIIAGRTGEGKSAMSLSIANNVGLIQNKPVVFFSLEMSTKETINRLICQLTGIPFKNVYQGKMTTDEQWKLYKEATQQIGDGKIFFDDEFGMTVPQIRSKIRRLMERDIRLIVIDQLEQVKGYEGQAAHIQMDKNAYDIKNITKEFEVPIILNHQLNRGVTDRKLKNPEPMLADLNQAGEKPADQVWIINHNKDEKGKIMQSKIKILKNRNGPQMEFAVLFLGERMLFTSPTRKEDSVPFQSTLDDNVIDGLDDSGAIPGWSQ